jgi:hypothetical protein
MDSTVTKSSLMGTLFTFLNIQHLLKNIGNVHEYLLWL